MQEDEIAEKTNALDDLEDVRLWYRWNFNSVFFVLFVLLVFRSVF